MTAYRVRAAVAAALMVLGASAAYIAKPSKHLSDQIGMPDLPTLFPKQFGDWRADPNGSVVIASPEVQALLDKIYNQTLARTYVNSAGVRMMLSVAYGGDQSDGTSAHRPEVCYPAQGFAITANRLGTLAVGEGRAIPIRQLMSTMGPRNEPITYWVVVGDEVVTTGIGQKLAQMRYGVRGVIADGMLVRVSSIDSNRERAYEQQSKFLSELRQSMTPAGAKRVFGGNTV